MAFHAVEYFPSPDLMQCCGGKPELSGEKRGFVTFPLSHRVYAPITAESSSRGFTRAHTPASVNGIPAPRSLLPLSHLLLLVPFVGPAATTSAVLIFRLWIWALFSFPSFLHRRSQLSTWLSFFKKKFKVVFVFTISNNVKN